ncbi:MAG: type II toxin-antitoxin system VapC family toxin [Chloroflexi bacterium]|nr:type II toxin-antitoxin system VapC family toxin [Chloroflexota bacterium]
MAAQHGLRGADAVYAAVAKQAASTLITLDNEHLTRLTDIITTCIPAAVLDGLMLAAQTEDDDLEQHQEDGQS